VLPVPAPIRNAEGSARIDRAIAHEMSQATKVLLDGNQDIVTCRHAWRADDGLPVPIVAKTESQP